eukprot:TRINITY_DN3570_c0_g1_i4.p1 TRINITY_DN3570_c0_g1~~TRINITY_DN3570_c0_g1_i4.p1  ORF type:complete len:140 (+),score=16.85 TRINITY_DN3570_c0_g1_i4:162-581(+)
MQKKQERRSICLEDVDQMIRSPAHTSAIRDAKKQNRKSVSIFDQPSIFDLPKLFRASTIGRSLLSKRSATESDFTTESDNPDSDREEYSEFLTFLADFRPTIVSGVSPFTSLLIFNEEILNCLKEIELSLAIFEIEKIE